MTDEQAPVAGSERPIQFRGRELWVRLPREEQIMVYGRTLKMLEAPEAQDWNGEQVMKALERVRRIVDSVLVNKRVDAEWLDDLMLDGDLTLVDACQILQLTLDAFIEDKPVKAAKKAAPRKHAARRKVVS